MYKLAVLVDLESIILKGNPFLHYLTLSSSLLFYYIVLPVQLFLYLHFFTLSYRANPPPAAVIFIFQYILLPLFPKQCLPSAICSLAGSWGEPGGLRWGHNMRLGTAYALMQMLGSLGTELQRCLLPDIAPTFH